MVEEIWDVVVVGAGPAGLSAGIYARRAGLSCLILERAAPGGQLLETDLVENFPGFPEPIPGPELMEGMKRQAERLGAEIKLCEAENLTREEGGWVIGTSTGEIHTRTVILAMGARHKELPAKGAKELTGRGVSYCATCDGYFFRGKRVLMVGAGDSALIEALFLAKLCDKVFVAVRHPKEDPKAVRAVATLRERALREARIEFLWNVVVEEVRGEGRVSSVVLRDLSTGQLRELPIDGVFVKIGYRPATDWLDGVVELTEEGYIRTDPWMHTSAPGVFAAGDVREPIGRYAQAVVAAAEGAMAALEAERYISEGGGDHGGR
ncbi:MAG: Thioredoxin reductase [Acetothermia bacterium 64_32]|nr:MAG: Thioredoxin reductase [Acetothermia bacterium 64_32]HAF71154.1 thioredoxin-disulfide reductase [Candidatus Acetothermia bacterium]